MVACYFLLIFIFSNYSAELSVGEYINSPINLLDVFVLFPLAVCAPVCDAIRIGLRKTIFYAYVSRNALIFPLSVCAPVCNVTLIFTFIKV
jgi:hypothetical protein